MEILRRGISRSNNCRSQLEREAYERSRGGVPIGFLNRDPRFNVVYVVTLPN